MQTTQMIIACSIKINPDSENSEIIRTAAAIALLIILKKQ